MMEEIEKIVDAIGDRVAELIKEFEKEGDRSTVIIGAAKLDILLYQLLVKFLIPSPGNRDDLFDGDSPLSTFSAKINICYRLGLIENDFARALHLVRKIRNSFAHEFESADLSAGAHRDRVKELIAPVEQSKMYQALRKTAPYKMKSESAVDFRIIVSMMVSYLESKIHRIMPLQKIDPATLVHLCKVEPI